MSENEWDEYSGDNTRFDPQAWDDGVDERAKTPESIAQIYTDLSKTIFGERKLMNTGYLNDIGYHDAFGTWHAGLDINGLAGTSVKTPVGGLPGRGRVQMRAYSFVLTAMMANSGCTVICRVKIIGLMESE